MWLRVKTCREPAKFPCTHVGKDIYSRSVWPKSQLGFWLSVHFALKKDYTVIKLLLFRPILKYHSVI